MTKNIPKQDLKKERRANYRMPTRIWAKEKMRDTTYFHLVSNISPEGLHIEKKLPFPVGEMINLELELPDTYGKMNVRGSIINIHKDPDSNITGTGVEFVEISKEDKKKIEVFLDQTKKGC